MIQPLRDLVLIEVEKKDNKTAAGLLIVEAWESPVHFGTILARGKDVQDVNLNDHVVFNPYAAIQTEEEDLVLVRASQILGVVNE